MRSLLCAALLAALAAPCRADVKLPSVFGSHMVLQRDVPIPVWGWAAPGEKITATLGGATETATADAKGDWKVTLPAAKASAKGRTLTVQGKNKVEFEDVLIGEVWIGSGQSNMEWNIDSSKYKKENLDGADQPTIRLYHVPKAQSKSPAKDIKAAWRACSPKTVGKFSAVLYLFGRKLQEELKVPVGLINTSWGGSPIQPWTIDAKGSGGMYNAMVAPLVPFPIKGVVWYQGESNVGEGFVYAARQEALIKGWRKAWGSEFPFLFVQIAPWSGYGKGKLPELWEGQAATLKLPKTGMAVITDLVDNVNDIHPRNKRDVAARLALIAQAKAYGKKDIVYSGPMFKSVSYDVGKVIVSFAHVGGGLKTRDGKPLAGFEIASADGKFVPAKAAIEGDKVVVTSKDVAVPTQARFGWSKLANPNLINKEGLPAAPFRTKDWRGGTGE